MSKYTVDYSKEEIIEALVKEWVLKWCKEHNPEVFDRARGYISRVLEKEDEN